MNNLFLMFNIAQYNINKMELFLSLNRKLKKSNLSPGAKKKRIERSLNNTSTSTNRSTKTISNQRNSLSFRSSRLKSNERTFAQNAKMLTANIDLKFSKIKNCQTNNTSTSLSPKEEERIINSLQEGIKLLPNGRYLIQATKILNIKNFTNDTKQSDFNSSTTMCSKNTNGCKRISLPFNPKEKLSPIKYSICKSNSNNNNIMKKKKKEKSFKYVNKTFNTYGTVDSNNSKKSRNGNNSNIEKQKMIRIYFNHCTTINNRKGINI